MLRTNTCVASSYSVKQLKRCLRVKSVNNGTSPTTAVDSSAKAQATLDVLDSLLPADPVAQQAPVVSTSQPAAPTSTTATASSSSPDLTGWINLPSANSSTRSNPALDQQLRKAHQSFEAVMAFDGLAPEVINGRAAMLGFMAALSGETHGDSLFSQLMSGGYVPALAVIALVTLSSFAPALRQDMASSAALDFVVDTFVGSDGSKYYGTLRNGVPSGLGTCIWPNQCHYDGEWKGGLMHGFGTYVWKNGQRYDGEWKDGRRDGIGIKTYADGSMYDGFWRAGKKHGLGVFRPAPPEELSNSRRHSTGWQPGPPAAANQPQQQQPNAAAAGVGVLMPCGKVADDSVVRQRVQRVLRRGPRMQKKMGEVVYKGHYSYSLMLELQLGISPTTPAHPSTDFRWRDFCPRVFRRLRAAAGIDEADYMLSLAGSLALRQLNSPGKSGSMFLLSEDERFLVKTMRKSEMRVLMEMLPAYTKHMEKYPHSLITRFFGLHKVTPLHGRSVRFVVMANIFVTDLQIHRRYDIKGSTDGRTVGPAGHARAADGDPGVIFKDLDLDIRIVLEQAAYETLLAQLKADCELLRAVGVMDYSLLLGVHYPSRSYTRFSLERVPSASMDSLAMPFPQGGSPPPGGVSTAGPTAPGSIMSSFTEQQIHGILTGAAAAHTSHGMFQPSGSLAGLAATFSAGGMGAGAGFSGAGGLVHGASLSNAGARNWELHNAAAEVEEMLGKVMERMDAMGFPEERKKDVADLARLKILGGKLKKSSARKEPPSAVLQAMQQQRQGTEGQLASAEGVPAGYAGGAAGLSGPGMLTPTSMSAAGGGTPVRQVIPQLHHLNSLRGAFTGLGVPFEEDEEAIDTPMALGLPDPRAPVAVAAGSGMPGHGQLGGPQLGINMPALAVPVAPVAKCTGAQGGGSRPGGGSSSGAPVPGGVSAAGGMEQPQRRPEEVVLCFGIIDILQ
eukprot:gene5077-5318_t